MRVTGQLFALCSAILLLVVFSRPASAQQVRLAAPGQPVVIYTPGPLENPAVAAGQQLTAADRNRRQQIELRGTVVNDLA